MSSVVFLKSRAHYRGGLEKYTRYLIRAFVERGCKVTLLTTGDALELQGIKCYSLARDSKFTLYNLLNFNFRCQKWLNQNPQDVVFGLERTTLQTHYRAGSGVHAVYLKQRKLIDASWKQMSFKINPLHRTLLFLEKKAFESPYLRVLFTNSLMVKNEILSHYSTLPAKIEIVHNGVEWEEWQSAFETSFNQPKVEPFHFLFIGNDYKRKGLLFLLQGLDLLKNVDFRLTVIGKEKNLLFFKEWVTKRGLKEKVEFLGAQSSTLPFYQAADALVIPSIYDPFANVTIEALAMGLFVVSSPYNGGKEVLQPYSGTVIEELTSPESMAHALKIALAHPKTSVSAHKIRQSVKSLDFSFQLNQIVTKTLQL
jgi:UDP-glucose:(heptosyl)LPS alpha-1,3-glucosyltransferase